MLSWKFEAHFLDVVDNDLVFVFVLHPAEHAVYVDTLLFILDSDIAEVIPEGQHELGVGDDLLGLPDDYVDGGLVVSEGTLTGPLVLPRE